MLDPLVPNPNTHPSLSDSLTDTASPAIGLLATGPAPPIAYLRHRRTCFVGRSVAAELQTGGGATISDSGHLYFYRSPHQNVGTAQAAAATDAARRSSEQRWSSSSCIRCFIFRLCVCRSPPTENTRYMNGKYAAAR